MHRNASRCNSTSVLERVQVYGRARSVLYVSRVGVHTCACLHVRYKRADLAPTLAPRRQSRSAYWLRGRTLANLSRRQETTRKRACTWQWESRKARFHSINEHRGPDAADKSGFTTHFLLLLSTVCFSGLLGSFNGDILCLYCVRIKGVHLGFRVRSFLMSGIVCLEILKNLMYVFVRSIIK